MIGIYRTSFRCVAQFWWLYLLVAALLAVLPILLKSPFGSTGGTSVGYLFFVLFLHRYVLFGEGLGVRKTSPKAPKRSNWGFIWVNILIAAGVAAVAFGLLFGLAQNAVSSIFISRPGMLVLPLYWLALSLFGTALPASAANEPYGLALTLQRSRKTALGIAWRLLVGLGLFLVILLPVLTIMVGLQQQILGLALQPQGQSHMSFQIAAFALDVVRHLMRMTASTMAVVVLCEAYRRVQPAPAV